MPPRSKIAQLPPEIRDWLHTAIVQRGFGDIEGLTQELNALCKEGGVAISIGKSAVGEESKRVRRAQETIKATTEATKLIAETSRDDADSRSEATLAVVQTETFEVLLQLQELEDEVDPLAKLKVLSQVGKTVAQMSRARVNQARWRSEVEAAVKAAAAKVDKLAKKGGLDAATAQQIRAAILGIKLPAGAGNG